MRRAWKVEMSGCDNCPSRTNSIFCDLSPEELKFLSEHKSYSVYKKSQTIFHEKTQPQGLFCVYSGKIKIHKYGEDGKEQIVRFARKGDVLGYRALLGGEGYYASATCIEETVICYFPREIFFKLLRQNTDLCLKVIRLLAIDLKTAELTVLNMAQKQVRERVAEALIKLKEYYGLADDNLTINAILTREDIGNIAGTSTETSIRILSEFNKEKIVELEGKRIRIINPQGLARIANISA